MQTDEILDLVDNNDNIIGQMERGEVYKNNLHNFRVINCFIKNHEGKLWIPLRQHDKRMFPGCLDISCGGHVSSGESYEEAFRKEMAEELNIDIDSVKYIVLGTCNPGSDGTSSFMTVYELTQDEVPNYNPDEFQSYEWISPAELTTKIEGGIKSKDDLIKLVKKFYL